MLRKINRIDHYAKVRAQSYLRAGLGWAYQSPDGWTQQKLLQSMYALNRYAMLTERTKLGQVYLTQGIAKDSGQPLRVAFVGNWVTEGNNIKAFYENLLYQEGTVQSQELGNCHRAEYHRQAEKLADQVDLVAVYANELRLWKPNRGDWVMGPAYLRMSFVFRPGETWEAVEKRVGQEYNLRKLRKSGLTYHISKKEEDFQRFYHEMYVPLIKKRFGEGGEIMREGDCYNIFKLPGGGIMMITDAEGNVIGGGLENLWRKVLYAVLNGVVDGSQELIKKGALTAWYYFGMKRAYEAGCTLFDSGMCQSFLTDGVYIHKHRWGEEPSINYWNPWGVLLWAPSSSPIAVEWMKANPIHPKFARCGGPNLQPVYSALREAASV